MSMAFARHAVGVMPLACAPCKCCCKACCAEASALLCCAVFLQVRRVFWKLLELCPTPEAAIAADTSAIRDIIAPLGLHNKRAVAVQRLSQDYLQKEVRRDLGFRV